MIHRTPAALIAVLSMGLVFAFAAEARVPRDFVGVSSEDVFAHGGAYRNATLGAQAALGIGTIRQNFDWARIERAPGRYDFSAYDGFVAAAAGHGIRVLPILFNPPPFHAGLPVSRPTYPPKSNESMAGFAVALVNRYGPGGSLWRELPGVPKLPIRSWQIWNEPLLPVYWGNRPNAKAYVRMLRVVGRAIKRADRRAEIVTAGLPPSKLAGAIRLERFIKQIYKARGKRYFDTLAINSYARNRRELATLLRSVRRIMRRAHDRKAKLWITELGWGDSGPRHRFVVGALGQAHRISSCLSTIRKLRRRLRLRGVVYFSWRDARPYPPEYKDMWGLHTGLLDINGRPKPAFGALKAAVARLR